VTSSVRTQGSSQDAHPDGLSSEHADLGSLEFWGRPADERDRYFAHLRRDAPVSRHQPPEDILGLPDEGRMDYWAIVRYEDVRRISRDPSTFCSGQGVQFGDVPLGRWVPCRNGFTSPARSSTTVSAPTAATWILKP
jgi:hypothetical protein